MSANKPYRFVCFLLHKNLQGLFADILSTIEIQIGRRCISSDITDYAKLGIKKDVAAKNTISKIIKRRETEVNK